MASGTRGFGGQNHGIGRLAVLVGRQDMTGLATTPRQQTCPIRPADRRPSRLIKSRTFLDALQQFLEVYNFPPSFAPLPRPPRDKDTSSSTALIEPAAPQFYTDLRSAHRANRFEKLVREVEAKRTAELKFDHFRAKPVQCFAQNGTAPVEKRKMTNPEPFHLSTSSRPSSRPGTPVMSSSSHDVATRLTRATSNDRFEMRSTDGSDKRGPAAPFKARPVPKSVYPGEAKYIVPVVQARRIHPKDTALQSERNRPVGNPGPFLRTRERSASRRRSRSSSVEKPVPPFKARPVPDWEVVQERWTRPPANYEPVNVGACTQQSYSDLRKYECRFFDLGPTVSEFCGHLVGMDFVDREGICGARLGMPKCADCCEWGTMAPCAGKI